MIKPFSPRGNYRVSYTVVPTLESVDEILWCDHLSGSTSVSLTAFTYLTALALLSFFLLICLYIRTISSNLLTVHNLHLRTTEEERNPGYLQPKRKQSVIAVAGTKEHGWG